MGLIIHYNEVFGSVLGVCLFITFFPIILGIVIEIPIFLKSKIEYKRKKESMFGYHHEFDIIKFAGISSIIGTVFSILIFSSFSLWVYVPDKEFKTTATNIFSKEEIIFKDSIFISHETQILSISGENRGTIISIESFNIKIENIKYLNTAQISKIGYKGE